MGLLRESFARIPKDVARHVDLQLDASDRIRAILKHKGWKATDLSIAMGKTKSFISRLLSGDENVTLKTIAAVEMATGERVFSIAQGFDHSVAPKPESSKDALTHRGH